MEAPNTNQCYDIFTLDAKEDRLEFWTQYLCRAPAIEWPCPEVWPQGSEEVGVAKLHPTARRLLENDQRCAEPLSLRCYRGQSAPLPQHIRVPYEIEGQTGKLLPSRSEC